MGGQSSQQQQTQQSQSGTQTQTPWDPATPFLNSLLGNLGGINTGINPTQQTAITGLTNLGYAGNPYANSIAGYANTLLGGGNAQAQDPNISANLANYQSWLTPYASGANIGAANPYTSNLLSTLGTDISGQINSQFAGAGRDLSDANAQAVSRGLTQGLAPVLLGQYNQDVANQFNAANSLYGAGNTTAGMLTGTNQQALANQGQGVSAADSAMAAQAAPFNTLLQAGSLQTGLPLQTIQALAQIGVPIAGLGGTTTSTGQMTGNTNQTNNMSGAQQAWGWMNAFGNLFGGKK
jgi:hypothetical protein